MTREKAKKILPIIQAFAEGKEIEADTFESGWKVCDDLTFNSAPEKYRIKREPKYRPFESCDEFIQFWESHYGNGNRPKGTMPLIWVKNKQAGYVYIVIGFDKNGNEIKINDHWFNFTVLFDTYTFIDDTLCGIEVTE